MWILGALTLAAVIFFSFVKWRSHDDGRDMLDLGTVSTQWLAEYRQSQES